MPLTDAQLIRFRELGCVPRCLMRLSDQAGRPLTEDEFFDRYGGFFINQTDQIGMVDIPRYPDLCQRLQLPAGFSNCVDFDCARAAFDQGNRTILIRTEMDLRPGHRHEVSRHCSVLTGIGVADFSLWTPTQDGDFNIYDQLPRADWGVLQCKALIMV